MAYRSEERVLSTTWINATNIFGMKKGATYFISKKYTEDDLKHLFIRADLEWAHGQDRQMLSFGVVKSTKEDQKVLVHTQGMQNLYLRVALLPTPDETLAITTAPPSIVITVKTYNE